MEKIKIELIKLINNKEHSVRGEPQYEAYGDTYEIVGYNLDYEQEIEAFEEQKEKVLEDIEDGEFLEWDFINKHWDRLMSNDNLLNRVQNSLYNITEGL